MPIGGGKGGSDFDPKGRSDGEIMRFCQSFMTELSRHLGEYTDVPAGDIGVGQREIGYMFGQYKRITNRYESGVLTGKGLAWGGSRVRTEATGYGAVYFVERMLRTRGQSFDGKKVIVSGAGNVAIYTIEKVTQFGGRVIACSDSNGYVLDEARHRSRPAQGDQGKTPRPRRGIRRGCAARRRSIVAERPQSGMFRPISPCPRATQNELTGRDARDAREERGAWRWARAPTCLAPPRRCASSSMPACCSAPARRPMPAAWRPARSRCSRTPRAIPGASRRPRSGSPSIMNGIHDHCAEVADEYGSPGNYVLGANIAGFIRVAEAMRAFGVV